MAKTTSEIVAENQKRVQQEKQITEIIRNAQKNTLGTEQSAYQGADAQKAQLQKKKEDSLVKAPTPKTAAQKRDEAKILYDNYIQSEEYRQNLAAGMKAQTDEWMNATIAGSEAYTPSDHRDRKEQELKALVDHFTEQARQEEEQALMDADLQELEGMTEAERGLLEAYIMNRDAAFADQMNPMVDIGFGKTFGVTAPEALVQRYGSQQRVEELAESLKRSRNREVNQQAAQAGREGADSGLPGTIGHNIAGIGARAVGGLTGLMSYLQELGERTGRYETMDPNSIGTALGTYGSAVVSETAQNIAGDEYDETGEKIQDGGLVRQGLSYLYQGGMSAIDSGARALLGGGAAGGALLSATNSFAQTMSEASAQGATPAEAAALGIANAGIEYATEKVPLEKLVDAARTGGHSLKAIVKNALLQAGVEVTTEELSLIGTTLAEAAILREKSGYQQRINELVAGGASLEEARNTALRELVQEAGETAIVSATSGGMSEIGAAVTGNLAHREAGSAANMQQDGENAAEIAAPEGADQRAAEGVGPYEGDLERAETENAAPTPAESEAADIRTPTYEELAAKKDVPVIKVGRNTEGKTYQQLKNDVLQIADFGRWFDEPHTNADTGMPIFLTNKSFTHSFNNLRADFGTDTLLALENTPQLIENAVLVNTSAPKDARKGESKVHTFMAAIEGENGTEPVKITVKEYANEPGNNPPKNILEYFKRKKESGGYNTMYDLKALEVVGIESAKNEFGASASAAGSLGQPGAKSTPNSTIRVTDLMGLVKGDAEKYIPKPSDYNNEALQTTNANGPGVTPEAKSTVTSREATQSTDTSYPSVTPNGESVGASVNSVAQNGPEVNGNIDESGAQGADSPETSAEGGQSGIRGTGAAEANFSGLQQYESLISDDNVQRSRTDDARQEEILRRDGNGRTVSEFAGNVGNSEAISDRDVDTLKRLIQEGALGHDTQSMTEEHTKAVERIRERGAAAVRDQITRAVQKGRIDEHLIAEAEVLFAQYSNRRSRQEDAAIMLVNLAQMATQSGRQLNMFKLMRRLTPEGQLMTVKRNVQRYVDDLNENRSRRNQSDVSIDAELEAVYRQAAQDALSDEAAVESAVAQSIEDGMTEDAEAAAETALSVIQFSGLPSQTDSREQGIAARKTGMAEQGQASTPDYYYETVYQDGPRRRDANIQTNDMNERVGQRVADSLTRQARQQERSVEDILYSEIMRFANDKAALGRQQENRPAQTPNLEAMRDYYRYQPFFQNAWDIARNRVEQAMFSMQDGDPRIAVIEQFLASGDEVLGVENWNPIGALDYANPQSTVRRGAKEAANAAGIRMDNRSIQAQERTRQQMRDVLIENARNKEAAARRIAQVAVESMGLDGAAAQRMAEDVTRAFYNDLAQQSARRVAQLFGTDRRQQQRVQRSMQQRLAELYNMGAFSDAQYRQAAFDSIFGEGSGITIDDQLLENFVNAAGERREQAANAIYQCAAAQIRPTLGEQWDAWRNMAMLLNPKTHLRNMGGTAAFRPFVSAKRALGAGLERLLVDRENRTKAVLGIGEESRALLSWARADASSRAAQEAMQGSGTTGNDVRSAVEDARRILPGALDSVRKGNMRLMEKEDMIFKKAEYAASMASFLKARGYSAEDVQEGRVSDSVLAQGRELAVREAQKATFNDRNRFSDAIAGFRVRGTNPFARAANAMAKGLIPFTRTPANVLVRAVEYSPAGIARGIATITDAVRTGESTMSEGIDQIAAGLTGTGAMVLGAALAAGMIPNVRLVGKIEDEDEAREGAQEYSIQVGDTYYGISWLAPANMPLFIGANLYNRFSSREETGALDGWDILSGLAETATDTLDPILEMSVLSTLADALESASYEDSAGGMLLSVMATSATSYFTQALPTILGQAEQATETTRSSVYSNADNPVQRAVERAIGNATKRIPGIDLYQTEKLDEFGSVVENEGGIVQRAFNAFLNPFSTSRVKDDALTLEVTRLNGSQPDSVTPPDTPKSISYTDANGERHSAYRLTEEEYSTLATVQGQTAKSILDKIIETDTYAAMTDQQKVSVFQYVYDYARERGRTEALAGYAGMTGWMAGIEDDPVEAIISKAVTNAFSDAFSQLSSDAEAAAQAMEQAYGLIPKGEREAFAEEAGGRVKYFFTAAGAGVDAQTFAGLYQTFREIDEDPDLNTSGKAAEWSYQLQKAKEAGQITRRQMSRLKDSMVYYQMFPAETAKFDQMTESGLSADEALDVGKLMEGIAPQAGYTNVRDVQKAAAIAGSRLSAADKIAAMKVYLPEAQDENLELMLGLGYSAEDYAAVYEIYASESGTGKKRRIIARIREELGVDQATAKKIYDIYG